MSLELIENVAPSTLREGSRSDAVYRSLLSWIEEGRVPVEGKLPTENELTQHFQVSRPVVRAAIAKLRDQGLVRSVQGSGTIVIQEPISQAVHRTEVLQGSSVRDLQRCFEFRLLIESEAAYLAALRHSPASLKQISERVYPPTHTFPAVSQQPLEAFDFHQSVVLAADNTFLEKSMQDRFFRSGVSRSTCAFAARPRRPIQSRTAPRSTASIAKSFG